MSDTSNSVAAVLPVKQGDGLLLRGLVVSVETVNRSWEGTDYRQVNATVANGVKTFRFVADDKRGGELPRIQPFTRISVDVEYANTEKGQITVRGKLGHE